VEEKTEALVNTVNCVGVMGKGIALQFKQAFPDVFKQYKKACDAGAVQPGQMFTVHTGDLLNPRYIINFPTKRHWKGRSRLEDIQLSGAEKYDTQKLNTVTRENSILSANSAFFFKDAAAGGGLV
jgi:O-acetyl-ADP-ribose deacetylase (regulator of RNase III)